VFDFATIGLSINETNFDIGGRFFAFRLYGTNSTASFYTGFKFFGQNLLLRVKINRTKELVCQPPNRKSPAD
jgi:hypothetical protein